MMHVLNDPLVVTVCLALAVVRIYLEVVRFDFARLPLTARLLPGPSAERFHRLGFYVSLGYFILFAPGMLLS